MAPRLLQQFIEPKRPCAYLPGQSAQLEIRVQVDVSADELASLLERGWRRFGPVYFRPVCDACNECVTLRVEAASFKPSRSQRRALKQAERLVRAVSTPTVDEERLSLYRRWHAHRESLHGWDPNDVDEERYAVDFAFPHPAARELTFRDPNDGFRLVGVGLFDETPHALSAIYFYWDPALASMSLGVANVVSLMDYARVHNLPHVYLGYRVLGCASLLYKTAYRPHSLLVGRPGSDETPQWEDDKSA